MDNCKVIAITNQKGGVGKTTTTVNLGVGLSMYHDKKVLLIDADPQSSLTASLLKGQNPDQLEMTLTTVMDETIEDRPIDEFSGILHHDEGVDLLPSNIELSGMETGLFNIMSREYVLRNYIDSVRKNYDYILIDCMPSLGMMTINALVAADSVIIPSQPSFLSTKGLNLLLHSINKIKRGINPSLKIDGILFTMVNNRTNNAKDIIGAMRDTVGQNIRVFDTEIPHSVRAAECSVTGESIFTHDKGGKVAAAYGSDDMIVQVALSQIGNVGGEPYWSWYGFGSRVEWCACFVSWCADQCGYIETGICPKYAGCVNGVAWFKEHNQWIDGSETPSPGMIIFYDWDSPNGESGPQDGESDHTGIVEKVENGIVYTVEGNSGDACRQRQRAVGDYEILGYGVLIP